MPTKKKAGTTKAKKVAKRKVSTKRSSKKKSTSSGKAVLVCAHGSECFWTTDGKILSNLIELRDSFAHMADRVFKCHVTKDKNDFAEWVEHVLMDAELADALRRAKKPKTARTVVVRRLKIYDI